MVVYVGRLLRARRLPCRLVSSNPWFLAVPIQTHPLIRRITNCARRIAFNYNAKIIALGRQGKLDDARKVFVEMLERDVFSWTSMITAYVKSGNLLEARNLFDEMPEKNVVSCSVMIDGYAKAGRMAAARRIFDEMPERNVFSWTSLIGGYLRIGRIDEAWELFERIPAKNAITWTTMILGCARNGKIDLARRLFDEMPDKNVVAWTVMLQGYITNGKISDARHLFDSMPERNLYSWNCMISGYLSAKLVDEALHLFNIMPRKNVISWTAMITGLLENDRIKDAREIFDCTPERDIAAWNAMLLGYSSNIQEATKLFQAMPDKNLISWNIMINIYSKNGNYEEALNHLKLMQVADFRPNASTLTSVLTARASVTCIARLHALAILLGLDHETSLSNALITMYSKSGDLAAARLVFECLVTKDVVSWTAVILAHSQHGDANAALGMFSTMLKLGMRPDGITFVGVLSACAHTGLLHEGWTHFNAMKQTYGIEPELMHYACMVDLLGRCGRIDEAEKLISDMPFKPDTAVWGALLSACRLHGKAESASRICQELHWLEPSSSGSYVLLANMYASVGNWDEVAAVRKRMKERGVRKDAGYSEIEVMGKTHTFFVGDAMHNEMEMIYDMMHLLLAHMKGIGNLFYTLLTVDEMNEEMLTHNSL